LTIRFAIGIIAALAIYDIGRAATIRCVRPDDRQRIVTLGDMDVLPGIVHFPFQVRATNTPWHSATSVVSRSGIAVELRGNAYDADGKNVEGELFATVDGLSMLRMEAGAGEKYVTIPPADLPVGRHIVSFDVVPLDLRGYFIPVDALQIDVR